MYCFNRSSFPWNRKQAQTARYSVFTWVQITGLRTFDGIINIAIKFDGVVKSPIRSLASSITCFVAGFHKFIKFDKLVKTSISMDK